MANDEVGYKAVDIDMENKFVLFLGFVVCTILGFIYFVFVLFLGVILGLLDINRGIRFLERNLI